MEVNLKSLLSACTAADRITYVTVVCMHVGGTLYLWKHASDMNFATWAGFSTTVAGVFHWLSRKDVPNESN